MPYIAFASAKASPGVTTTLAALAVAWPEHRYLHVVELDPAGGDLAVRFDLSPEPGLVTLAAAGRRGLDPTTFRGHTQDLPTMAVDGNSAGLWRRALVGPVGAEQAIAALSALRGELHRTLSTLGSDVLVDCGRLDPGSPVVDVVNHADLLVVVARPIVAEVHHLATRLTTLRPKAVSLLLVGERPYSVGEVAATVGASPLASLPTDPRAAQALASAFPHGSGALRRSRLLRSSRTLAAGLVEWLGGDPQRAQPLALPAGPPPQSPPLQQPSPPPPLPPPPTPPAPTGQPGGGPQAPPTAFPPLPGPPTAALSRTPPDGNAMHPPPRHFRRDSEGSRR
ncbi:MAG: hypothetical protein ACRD2C_04770 [Acidimicrobiales bacterium]